MTWRRISALSGLQKLFEFLDAHAFLGKSAPLDTGCANWTGIQVPALLALRLWLVGPYFDFLSALLAADIFGLGRPNLCTSWATFLKHVDSILPEKKKINDSHHIQRFYYPSPTFFSCKKTSLKQHDMDIEMLVIPHPAMVCQLDYVTRLQNHLPSGDSMSGGLCGGRE